jgi:hypothetical protein
MSVVSGRSWAGLFIVAILGSLTHSFAASADERLKTFSYGSGQNELGYLAAGEDALDIGPAAIAADSGKVYVLDRVNKRVISFAASANASIDSVGVDKSLDPVDLALDASHVWIFDQLAGMKAVGISQNSHGALGQAESGGENPYARGAFSSLGFGLHLSIGGAPEAGGALSGETLIVPDDQMIKSSDGRPFRARFVPQPLDLHRSEPQERGRIVLSPADGGDGSIDIVLVRAAKVKAARVLRVVPGKEVLVATDEVRGSGVDEVVETSLLRISSDGNIISQYKVPIEVNPGVVSQSVAVDRNTGRVFALVVTAQEASVLELTPEPAEEHAQPAAPSLPVRGPTTSGGSRELGAGVASLSRLSILTEANGYITTQWAAHQADADSPKECDPSKGIYRQKPRLIAGPNSVVKGVPYCWGCDDSVTQFLDGVQNGRKVAGNTCARRNCPECIDTRNTAGVDCSGFVSNVWRLGGRVTTSSMSAVADRISIDELMPGDVLNKAGNHVRLYAGEVATSVGKMVIVYEASVTCGGTCLRTVSWSDFQGYEAYRRRGLSN